MTFRESIMSTSLEIFIALEIWGTLFVLLLALCIYRVGNRRIEEERWMLRLLLATSVLLSSDAVTWIMDHVEGRSVYAVAHLDSSRSQKAGTAFRVAGSAASRLFS